MSDQNIVPKCPKCGGASFEAVKQDVKGADNSMVFVVCANSSCNNIISVVPYTAAWDV